MKYLFLLLFTLPAVAQTLTRGPYLQQVGPNGITVRWRTEQPTDSRVRYVASSGSAQTATDAAVTTEHIVTLTGLQPATPYSYTIGSSAGDVAVTVPATFRTAPVPGSRGPFRIWALGDFGNSLPRQFNVLKAYRDRITAEQRPADLWLWLGDNAYDFGYEWEFQKHVFGVYDRELASLPFYSVAGNHEYPPNDWINTNIPYYDLITVPQRGELGGVPSGSKLNYSFDYGNVHLVSLDSYVLEGGTTRMSDTTGRQALWLKQDLAANKQPWTVVFFHHPPYGKGSRNSDVERELMDIREKFTPILERYGVDLVLTGHCHSYERSFLMRNHTGLAATFNPAQHAVSTSTGRYDGSPNSCPILPDGRSTVYVVNGAGGAMGRPVADFPLPAMVFANAQIGGSMILDVNDNRLDARWITETGDVLDQFTLMKGVNRRVSRNVNFGDTLQFTASWPAGAAPGVATPGTYQWTGGGATAGATTRTASFTATAPGVNRFEVRDARGCLSDVFTVNVAAPLSTENDADVRVFPNPTYGWVTIEFALAKPTDITLRLDNAAGAAVQQKQLRHISQQRQEIWLPAPGTYLLRLKMGDRNVVRKLVRQ